MDQFGVRMHFLWIIQILWIVFTLKTHFLYLFPDFNILWTGPQLQKCAGASTGNVLRLRLTLPRTVGCLCNSAGFSVKRATEGVQCIMGHWITIRWPPILKCRDLFWCARSEICGRGLTKMCPNPSPPIKSNDPRYPVWNGALHQIWAAQLTSNGVAQNDLPFSYI
jgi:hypothetical protein